MIIVCYSYFYALALRRSRDQLTSQVYLLLAASLWPVAQQTLNCLEKKLSTPHSELGTITQITRMRGRWWARLRCWWAWLGRWAEGDAGDARVTSRVSKRVGEDYTL